MQSNAATVKEYLASLPADRRATIEAVRKVVNANLGKGYQEGMQYGMIGWHVPHSIFPHGYHCDPKVALPFTALASQKNYCSLYLSGVYDGCEGAPMKQSRDAKWFREAWAKTGKKLDMGKCCIRFQRAEDLALDVIAEAIRRVPVAKHIEDYIAALASVGKGPDGKKLKAGAPPSKGAPKKAPAKNAGGSIARKRAAKASGKKAGAARK